MNIRSTGDQFHNMDALRIRSFKINIYNDFKRWLTAIYTSNTLSRIRYKQSLFLYTKFLPWIWHFLTKFE